MFKYQFWQSDIYQPDLDLPVNRFDKHEDKVGGSKTIGEPPFMLAFSVYEAIS